MILFACIIAKKILNFNYFQYNITNLLLNTSVFPMQFVCMHVYVVVNVVKLVNVYNKYSYFL